VITAAKLFGARGLGVEIDPRLVEVSNRNAQLAGVSSQARFVEQDLFKTDLAQASVITMYLLPEVNLMLKPALRMLKPGTRIVSHDWDMGPDWLPEKTLVVPAPDKQIGLRREAKLMRWTV
jgi:tRNA G37 N-methylase Trm5